MRVISEGSVLWKGGGSLWVVVGGVGGVSMVRDAMVRVVEGLEGIREVEECGCGCGVGNDGSEEMFGRTPMSER